MDFDLSDDQRLLQDTLARVMADHHGFDKRKAAAASERGWSDAAWSQYAQTGLTGLLVPEAHDGFGGGAVEMMVAMEAMGGALALEPWFASSVMGVSALVHGESEAARAAILPGVAAGATRLALACLERNARHDLGHVATAARVSGDGVALDGEKTLALHGDSADVLIVSARAAGGIGLFAVDARGPGVTLRGYRTQDSQRAAEVTLHDARALFTLAGPGAGLALLERVVDTAIAALCSEAVGAMAAAHAMTVDYLKLRKQFGAPIGSFQVLQHRAADMFMALEQARSMAILAGLSLGEEPATRSRMVRAAKIQIGRSAKFIGQEAVQLHGGIGVTMEHAIGHYFKRLTMIDTLFGDADHHLGLLAASGGSLF